jgi:hypothetical protein
MGSQPSFYNGCIFKAYIDTVICKSIIFVEPNSAYRFISAVLKFGGFINLIYWWIYILAVLEKETNTILLFCFVLLYFGFNLLGAHYSKLIILK